MRIVRIKLKPDLRKLLGEISHSLSIEDRGLAEDLFCLLRNKGSGLPADDRLELMADVIAKRTNRMRGLVLLGLRKRRYVLKQLAGLMFFKALAMEHAAAPADAVRILLQTFREMSRKIRQAQCLTCQFRKNCDFGTQFGDTVKDITKVVDPNFDKKVHAECPVRPEIDQLNQMAAFAQQFAAMTPSHTGLIGAPAAQMQKEFDAAINEMEKEMAANPSIPDEDASHDDLDPEEMSEDFVGMGVGGAGRSHAQSYNATHAGATYSLVNQKMVKQMTTEKMVLFEIGHALNEMLSKATKGKYKPSSDVSEKSKIENLKSTTEITSVAPVQHALPDDQFNARVAKRSLQIRKFEKEEDKKFLLYVLIDNSGSMVESIGDRGNAADAWGLVTRGQIASTLAIALFTRVRDDGGYVFLRFFDDWQSPLVSAKKKPDFEPIIRSVMLADYNGGGTNISGAVKTALDDISKAKDDVRDAEILVISDADDTVIADDEKHIADMMKKHKIKMNFLNINTNTRSHGNAATVFPRIATKYLKVNPKNINLAQFVELVK
jgi:uncharacterized protein with von Willebrand factor type A (vWA) domain